MVNGKRISTVMDGMGGGATRTQSDDPSNSPAIAEQGESLPLQLILSELVATIGEPAEKKAPRRGHVQNDE